MRCVTCSSPVPEGNQFCGVCGSSTDPANAPTRVSRATHNPLSAGVSAFGGSDPLSGSRFLPGTVVAGRYRIVGLIGRGGMGEVCRADDLKLNQPVALKFLPEALERQEDRLVRFLNEVKIARQISHPNVCRVYDIGDIEGQHFISMEYVDGEDLSSLLRRIGRLPTDKAIQIARQLCAGLAAAHEKGILHRDLKPANVMIDGRGQVRITDFGLAGLAEEITGAELHAGTPDYMAPEQLAGKEVSVKSDLYSLGHVLYQLFTGRPAFRADSFAEISRLQREATPASPSTLVDGFDPAVDRVILRCLEKDPRDRPASALAISAALPGGDPLAAALAAGETPSPEMVAAAGPEGGLRPAVALACLAAIALGIVAVVLFLGQTMLYRQVPLDKPIAVLENRAREIARSFGYDKPPADDFGRFAVYRPALDYMARQDDSASRWDPLSEPGQIALYFAYRQSDEPLAPLNLSGVVRTEDPPPQPGDIRISLSMEGRLLSFLATPPIADHSAGPPPPMDWNVVFEAAGLSMQDFEPTSPTIQPQAYADTRAAWDGVLPHRGDLPVRVEASALGGKPVYFETVTPYDPYWSEETEQAADRQGVTETVQEIAGLSILLLVFGGAGFLARRNWKLGRGDRRGALRLALYVLALRMLSWMVTGHHVVDFQDEFGLFVTALGGALLLALLTWVLYVAIEPYFRRLWPQALVSWTRLLAGRLHDPLVGRDLLLGFTFGIGLQLLVNVALVVPAWLGMPPNPPAGWAVDALSGGRWAFGMLFSVQLSSLPSPLGYIVLFLLLRIVLRRQWLAVTVFSAIMATFGALQFADPGTGAIATGLLILGALLGVAEAIFLMVLMLRFGLLSMVGCFLMFHMFVAFPVTFDPAAPYFATTLFALVVVVSLCGFAFYSSLAGRPLFQDAILQEQT